MELLIIGVLLATVIWQRKHVRYIENLLIEIWHKHGKP